MLVLFRKIGQSFFIGEKIKITVAGVEDSKAKIAIDAPRELSIDREENLGKELPQCGAKAIHIRWDTDDVHAAIDELDLPTMTNDQAFSILKDIFKTYDMNEGLNWGILKKHLIQYWEKKAMEHERRRKENPQTIQ